MLARVIKRRVNVEAAQMTEMYTTNLPIYLIDERRLSTSRYVTSLYTCIDQFLDFLSLFKSILNQLLIFKYPQGVPRNMKVGVYFP